jgi:hypothetical protein
MIKKKSTVLVLGLFLLSLMPMPAVAVERLGSDIYFPSKAGWDNNLDGASTFELDSEDLDEMEIHNSTGSNNNDGLDGSMSIRVSQELNQSSFSSFYSSSDDTYSIPTSTVSDGTDLTVVRESNVLNDVSVQTKWRFFDPGKVARLEVLLTAATDTTRVIELSGNYGSDGSTRLVAQRLNNGTTSYANFGVAEIPDTAITSSTQWIVTSDDANSQSDDPLIGTVLRGATSTVAMNWTTIPGDSDDDWEVRYTVVLPANQTVSLVLFHAMFSHVGDVSAANLPTYVSGMSAFNTASGNFFTGLTAGVPILNWGDLAQNRTVFYQLDEVKPKKIAPSAPSTPVARLFNSSSAQVSFQRPADLGSGTLLKFDVYRNGAFLISLAASSTRFIDSSLEKDVSYSYQVIAVSSDGTSKKSRTSNSIYRR